MLLLTKGWITSEQLRETLQAQQSRNELLGQLLMEREYINEDQLILTLSEQLRIPWAGNVQPRLHASVTSALPTTLCQRFRVFPIDYRPGEALVMAVDPSFTDQVIDSVRELLDCEVKPLLAPSGVLQDLINTHSESLGDDEVEVIEPTADCVQQAAHSLVGKWCEFRATRARCRLFEQTFWIRYSEGKRFLDHLILFESPAGSQLELIWDTATPVQDSCQEGA